MGRADAEILVVEDDSRTRRLERFVLEEEGFQVKEATSGEEALEALNNEATALVLLDLGLPGIDGLVTCQRIREHSRVPIIIVTAEDKDEDKVLGLEMGAEDYVTKPFSTAELAARVKAVLRRYEGDPLTKSETGGIISQSSNAGYRRDATSNSDLAKSLGNSRSKADNPDPSLCEGTVRLVVENAGNVRSMIRFVDAPRQNPLLQLLRLNADHQNRTMGVSLRLREPMMTDAVLLQIESVAQVVSRVGEQPERDEDETNPTSREVVLGVFLED